MSETTEVKGQFGLGQSGGTGKKLKIYICFTDMAFPWMPTIHNVQGRTNSWINGIVQHHDTFCGCDKPFFHLFYHLHKNNGYPQCSIPELNEIKKCLGGTETNTTLTGGTSEEPKEESTNGPEGDLDEGELLRLFDEDGPLTEDSPG